MAGMLIFFPKRKPQSELPALAYRTILEAVYRGRGRLIRRLFLGFLALGIVSCGSPL